MPPQMTDVELKQLMKQLAGISGLDLAADRLDLDLVAYKAYLAAIEKIRTVPLPVEAEPFVKIKR